MSYDAFDIFCNNETATTTILSSSLVLGADCLGENPQVNCPCCIECYNDRTGEYEINLSRNCDVIANQISIERNDENRIISEDDGGSSSSYEPATCNCVNKGFGDIEYYHNNITCNETCETCTIDGSICFTITDRTIVLSEDHSYPEYTSSTFEYTKGVVSAFPDDNNTIRNVVVEVKIYRPPDSLHIICSVRIDGQTCRSCSTSVCPNVGGGEFQGWKVLCDNIDLYGVDTSSGTVVDPCDASLFDVTTFGPLTLFALQDPYLRGTGCRPWI